MHRQDGNFSIHWRRSSDIKLIKRQMFGRAKFDLLRKRVLLAC